MDVHPTPFPGNKTQSVKSKCKKVNEAPKQKTKEAPPQRQRRTFGTICNTNGQEKTVPEKPKTKPPNKNSVKQTKAEPEILPAPKTESAKKTPQNGRGKNKKSVAFREKIERSGTKKTPVKEVDEAKTPVRPPFSVKPVKIPGTPYLSAEKCSSCKFDRLETASYWLGQIKTAESVGKHFVSAAFFRLANHCKAEPTRNLVIELKKYLGRHDKLSTEIEWDDVSRLYGILKKERESKSNDDNANLFNIERDTHGDFKVEDAQEQKL